MSRIKTASDMVREFYTYSPTQEALLSEIQKKMENGELSLPLSSWRSDFKYRQWLTSIGFRVAHENVNKYTVGWAHLIDGGEHVLV